jgi:hypothetical protein
MNIRSFSFLVYTIDGEEILTSRIGDTPSLMLIFSPCRRMNYFRSAFKKKDKFSK